MSTLLRAAPGAGCVGLIAWIVMAAAASENLADSRERPPRAGPLDPRGRVHIPIGIANTLDTLKTFVEAEGCFSPGVGSYGVYFWVYDPAAKKLVAPTRSGVACEWGLASGGKLIPWSRWRAGDVTVRTEVCEVRRDSPAGPVFVVGARAHLTNGAPAARKLSLYAALLPPGTRKARIDFSPVR